MNKKTALITGTTGQDGSYLSEFLIRKGYNVHGTVRRSSSINTYRIDHLRKQHIYSEGDPQDRTDLQLHYCDMTDSESIKRLIFKVKPNEIYNLAAQSHVGISFKMPVYTANVVATGALNLFESARDYQEYSGGQIKIYQAGSSEMFGSSPGPQNESTPFKPCSPYAVSKLAAHNYAINFRESYGMFIANGILFNHESPRRGENFVTRKITRAAARIKVGIQSKLYLGNLDSYRDWGHAKDYIEAMHLLLNQDKPEDIVIGTGTSISVKDFVEIVFDSLELNFKDHVNTSSEFMRPREVDYLCADISKASQTLNWKPKHDYKTLAQEMLENDLILAKKEKLLLDNGFNLSELVTT